MNQKHKAQQLANRFVPITHACIVCGSAENLNRHHLSYSRPLDVRIVCSGCHMKIHYTRNLFELPEFMRNRIELIRTLMALYATTDELAAMTRAMEEKNAKFKNEEREREARFDAIMRDISERVARLKQKRQLERPNEPKRRMET